VDKIEEKAFQVKETTTKQGESDQSTSISRRKRRISWWCGRGIVQQGMVDKEEEWSWYNIMNVLIAMYTDICKMIVGTKIKNEFCSRN